MSLPPTTEPGGSPEVEVPAPLRAAIVQVAGDVLGTLEPVEVPATLRQVRQFAPRRRALAGAGPLWAALHDPAFRARVVRVWAQGHRELAAVLRPPEQGEPDPDRPAEAAPVTAPADGPVEGLAAAVAEHGALTVAVGSWLLDTPHWPGLVEGPAAPAPADAARAAAERLARSEAEQARLRVELGAARDAAHAAQEELAALHRELRRLRSDADRARSQARAATQRADELATAAQEDLQAAREERAAAEAEHRAARAAQALARTQARTARDLADVRVRLLLDTIVDAADGLRTELALPPVDRLPADLVAPDTTAISPAWTGSRGRTAQDPGLVDELLARPRAHLVVDGYNVSKTWLPVLTLAEQRRGLVDALGRLAARTGAEVTCCFDGQEGHRSPPTAGRAVRVLFSVGEIADDLIRRLVHAEPPGRPLLVVTSDQQVTRDVEATGAWVVPSATFVERLRRL
ncbi:NYN domain-containing protein [Cellulomonas soli]|uniref:NYN domain-containing protein n=1 Tax=Cellulomonas soli TaxID=931535 RepID=UPI003F827320